nr:alpha-galactosidase [Candidatus Sigynarchaeota archaeon]
MRYILTYGNADARLVEEICIYPSLSAVLLNGSLIPETNFTFAGSRFDLVTCALSNILPFMDPATKWLSYFDGVDIWGNFAVKPVQTADVYSARTPALLHNTTAGMLVGAVTSERFEIEVMLRNAAFSIKMPIVDGYQAYNQIAIPLETCWIQFGSNFSGLFVSYAQQVRSFNPPVRAMTVDNFIATTAGTCDWYNRYGNINETTVLDDLDTAISLHDGGYAYYIVDSGWAYEDGTGQDYNWSSPWNAEKFPNGVAPLIAKAHGADFKLVLWNRVGFAPVWVQQQHPGWVASWGSWNYVIMNISMPSVQAYIEDVFATWASQGIDGVKVDFITDVCYQYAWNAHQWNTDKTRAQLVNQYLDLLDLYASTYNMPVLLCGTPIGFPSLARYSNLVASRVTCDSGYQGYFWDSQVATALLRSFWWNIAFNTPDPDAFDTKDMRSVLVASAIGGAMYYGDNYPGLKSDMARFAWTLRWDAPAVPENIAFSGKCIIARGIWQSRQVVIGVNIDGSSYQYFVDGLVNSTSAIRIMAPPDGIFAGSICSICGINGQHSIYLRPGHTEMQIFYQGQPPFPASQCMEAEIAHFITGLVIPTALLGVSVLVIFRKTLTKRAADTKKNGII